jgi:hypothetical protein
MCRANADYITSYYRRFDSTYRTSGFSQKNPGKYLLYTVEQVAEKVHGFYDGDIL